MKTILVRGGGDLATGVVQKFYRSGFRVVILETPAPTAIRRTVALSEAVYEGTAQVEDVTCRRVNAPGGCEAAWENGEVPLIVDPYGETIFALRPDAVIDAILAKRNVGTHMGMAKVTVGLGPGFTAGEDVHAVIETMRGHDLGRLILHGSAMPNTGTPGEIGGKSAERVIHAPASGRISCHKNIGDLVEKDEPIFTIGDITATAPFKGLLRGLLRDNFYATKGLKAADVDPRASVDTRTISDKARCLGGCALEAYFLVVRN